MLRSGVAVGWGFWEAGWGIKAGSRSGGTDRTDYGDVDFTPVAVASQQEATIRRLMQSGLLFTITLKTVESTVCRQDRSHSARAPEARGLGRANGNLSSSMTQSVCSHGVTEVYACLYTHTYGIYGPVHSKYGTRSICKLRTLVD